MKFQKLLLLLLTISLLGTTGCGTATSSQGSSSQTQNTIASETITETETETELSAEELYAILREEQLVPLLAEADQLALGYFYDEAIASLENAPADFAADEERLANIEEYKLAKDSELPVATLQNLYRGHTKSPTLAVVYKICNGLGVTIAEFLDSELFSLNILELD